MAIDIRASVSCNLGDIIQANISDSSILEAGLIRTTGVCEVVGTSMPAIGTGVTFTYTDAAGVTRTVPRRLFVLSSFANPYKRTTEIQLGCVLTYRADLREVIKWDALDDPANADFTDADQAIITVPISASSVMDYCLEQLDIEATNSPLTNKFSLAEFDYSGGYVQVLNDLLVSESYCGFINGDGKLEVFSLDKSGGSGPVLGIERIIDIGAVNAGPLPGEAVVVNYNTLKLKQPDPDAVNNGDIAARRRWELTEIVNGPVSYTILDQTYVGTEVTTTRTTYKRINGNDVPVQRITTLTGPTARKAGTIASVYLQNGIAFNNIDTELSKEVQVMEYDSNGQQTRTVTTRYEQEVRLFGDMSLDYVFSQTDYVPFTYGLIEYERTVEDYDNSDLYTQTTTSIYKRWQSSIPGQQAVAESRQSSLFSTSSQVIAFISLLKSQPLTLENTSVSISRTGETPSRPKDVLNGSYADGGDPANGYRTESSVELELALGSATAQRRVEFNLPYAPDDVFTRSGTVGSYTYSAIASDAQKKAALYGRVQNKLLLANRNGMSVQTAADVLPPRPFQQFTVTASGVSGVYLTNATNWTMSGEGIIVSTDGLFWGGAGAATSGTSSSTAFFPTSPTITTLPVAPAVVNTSPTAVIGTVATVGTTPQTVLDAAFPDAVAGDGVQDTSTDEFWVYDGTTWENVGTNPGPTMTVTTTVPVWNETVKAEGRTRLLAEVVSLGYPLAVLTEIPVLRTKIGVTVSGIKKVVVSAAEVSVAAQTPMVSIGVAVQSPAAAVSVTALAPTVSAGASVAVPAAAVAVAAEAPVVVSGASVAVPAAQINVVGQAPVSAGPPPVLLEMPAVDVTVAAVAPEVSTGASVAVPPVVIAVAAVAPTQISEATDPYFSSVSLLLHMDDSNGSTTFIDDSSNALTVTANGNAQISTAQSKFGGTSGKFDGSGDYLTVSSATAFALGSGEWTLEAWVYFNALSGYQNIIDFRTTVNSAVCPTIYTNGSSLQFDVGITTRISAAGALSINNWYHVAASKSGNSTRMFLNGTQVGSTYTDSNSYVNNSSLNIGRYPVSGASFLNGYIDDLRITKGIARYTSNFTPPTAAFPNS